MSVRAVHTTDAEQHCSLVGAVEVGGRWWVGATSVGVQYASPFSSLSFGIPPACVRVLALLIPCHVITPWGSWGFAGAHDQGI